MVYPLSERAPSASNLTAKNRVWGFFENSNRTRPANRRKPSETRRKNRPCSYKTASGIPYWPSRDPIEERGGVNLYGMLGNHPIGWVDILGLDFLDVQVHCDLTLTITLYPGKGWMGDKNRAIHIADPDDEWPPKKVWKGKTGKLHNRDWRNKDGPTPPGWWRVGVERDMATSEKTGNMFDGKNTAFKLSFDFIEDRGYEKTDRDYPSIRIHPDGEDNGTHGCLGISCADSKNFYDTIKDPKMEVYVWYDACCEIKGKETLHKDDPECCDKSKTGSNSGGLLDVFRRR